MKYITGFFMAWGNFCSIPCPVRLWDEKCRTLMLGFLPYIGFIIGIASYFLSYFMSCINLSKSIMAFVLTLTPFFLTGFIHIDGFMDCCDAILSRKPLEIRQKILKDSHVGAFAVICAIFIILGFYSVIISIAPYKLTLTNFLCIHVISRAVSGLETIRNKPMEGSQYFVFTNTDNKGGSKALGLIIMLSSVIVLLAIIVFTKSLNSLIIIFLTCISVYLSILYGRKNLGGISGDISGFGLVIGEFFGYIALAII